MAMSTAERMQRYRARMRGEDVPRVQPGPKPKIEVVKAQAPKIVSGELPKIVAVEAPKIVVRTVASVVSALAAKAQWAAFGELVQSHKITRAQLDAWLIARKVRWRGAPAAAEYFVADVERELSSPRK